LNKFLPYILHVQILATYFLADFLETEKCDFPNFKNKNSLAIKRNDEFLCGFV
jgi:hypothetical protein